ncbi:hypothetical protein HanPI659440_Chr13g0506571 [Helianthus annuus]|nr:hypothetical protein HanPI659440_Chr13g0506571 [Helianthus annuus]
MEGDTGITDDSGAAPTNLLLSPPPQQSSSWRLNIDQFRLPQTSSSTSPDRFSGFRRLFRRSPSNYFIYICSYLIHILYMWHVWWYDHFNVAK